MDSIQSRGIYYSEIIRYTVSMLLVKTKLLCSQIHGIGLFADQFIPKGTTTWKYNSKFDASFSEEQVNSLSEFAREKFFHYTYFDKELNKYVLCFDDLRFINHSARDFNIQSKPHQDVAVRDIQEGEELLCNYNDFEDGYFTRRKIDQTKFS